MKHLKKDILLSAFLSLSIVLSLLESFIPIFNNVIPGLKFGLANIMILLVLYLYSFREGIMISILRVIMMGILRTGIFTLYFYFSLVGALFSIVMMSIAKKTKLTIVGTNIIGSVFHSIGQLVVATIFLKTTGVFYYLPYLIIISCITGTIIGFISKELLERLKKDCIL